MASKFISSSVILMVLLCLLLMRETFDCNTAYECVGATTALKEIRNRKMLSTLKDMKTTTLKASLQVNGEKPLNWELRKVPSGPDPLHHNGGTPKKPEIP